MPDIPIIMLTGHCERCASSRPSTGVNEYLTKPVSARAIYDRLFIMTQPRPVVHSGDIMGPSRQLLTEGVDDDLLAVPVAEAAAG